VITYTQYHVLKRLLRGEYVPTSQRTINALFKAGCIYQAGGPMAGSTLWQRQVTLQGRKAIEAYAIAHKMSDDAKAKLNAIPRKTPRIKDIESVHVAMARDKVFDAGLDPDWVFGRQTGPTYVWGRSMEYPDHAYIRFAPALDNLFALHFRYRVKEIPCRPYRIATGGPTVYSREVRCYNRQALRVALQFLRLNPDKKMRSITL
jgi:hypothetical protein